MAGTSSGPEARWTPASTLADLKPGSTRLLRVGHDQVALFRLSDGRVFAVDNRCPHEGYPLVQGAVSGQTLTCVWHNFKFDLKDGACLLGDEAVRSYPVRVIEDQVEVDLRPPDQGKLIARLWSSLAVGLEGAEVGRMARDTARLIEAGVDPVQIAATAARWDALHAEYGTTHALPVAADVASLARHRLPGQQATLPLVQLLEITARPSIRQPERAIPAPVDPGEDPVAAGLRLQALVEAEDAAGAEALMRGALAKGWGRQTVEPWLLRLCADHFLDFGHALIYSVKVMDLLELAGWEHADPLLSTLVYSVTLGTREDLLPPWAGTRRRLEIVSGELPRWAARPREAGPGWTGATDSGPRTLRDAILDGSPADAFNAVRDALRDGAPLDRICDGLVLAASERILRFDPAIARAKENQNDWLDVSHLLTFASAVRHALTRCDDPSLLRLLFQSAHFTQRAGALDGPRQTWKPAAEADLSDLGRAVEAKDPARALSVAAALLERHGGPEPLVGTLLAFALDDPAVRGIVVAHVLKTLMVALDETGRLGDPSPLLATLRFAASPQRERRVARVVHEAIELVVHGRIPRDLTASGGAQRGGAKASGDEAHGDGSSGDEAAS